MWPTRTILAVMLAAGSAFAREEQVSTREENLQRVERTYLERLDRLKHNPDMLVRRGLLADRRAKRVVLQAEATALARNDPVEFFLVGEQSGHDYEALAVCFAAPGAVHEALVFIGMTPGRPVDASGLRFWPKGERVRVSFAPRTGNGRDDPLPVERFVLDDRTGTPLPEAGLVFVGSRRVEAFGEPGRMVYAADAHDPHAVATTYNDSSTVLDVPRNAPQGAVYDRHRPNPEMRPARAQFMDVILEPEHVDGTRRVIDLALSVTAAPGTRGACLAELRLGLTGAGQKPIDAGGVNDVLAAFAHLNEQGRDPFVVPRFDPGLALSGIRELCTLLGSIDNEKGIRIEPPPAGQLYYRAFVPNEAYRDREARNSHPWELRLARREGGVRATLTSIKETWPDDRLKPDLTVTETDLPTPQALPRELARPEKGLPVILVFAEGAMTYAEVLRYLTPDVLQTHGTVHVFVEEGTGAAGGR